MSRFGPALAAAVVLLAPSMRGASAQSAQPAQPITATLEGGPSFSVSSGYSGGLNLGLHVGASVMQWTTPRWGVSAEAAAHALPSSGAQPSCAPGGQCVGRTFIPSQLYSGGVAVVIRPAATSRRLQLAFGAGGYLGDAGIGDSPWTASLGFSASTRVMLRADGRGLGLDVRYQHFTKAIGEMRGLLAPAFVLTF